MAACWRVSTPFKADRTKQSSQKETIMTNEPGFPHRTISGWISDFSSIPRLEPWPSITLDLQMEQDLDEAISLAESAKYTGIILWGLLAGRSWAPFLPQTVDNDRRERVKTLLEAVRSRGLKAIMGLGLYSWGFDAIIASSPAVDGGAPDKMCGSRPESWEWMRRVVDYIFDEYNPDGVSMQSSDQGRCPCDACQEVSSVEYHARINDQVAGYIRSRWPEKLIEVSTWGMDLGNPDDLPFVQQMSAHADILNDFNNSSARRGRDCRKAMIAALPVAFGTEQGWWVDPPPFWDRLKWFLPFSLSNVPYWRELHDDGGRAIQRYILPIVNPGAEVGYRFDGLMLADLSQDPQHVLAGVLDEVFEPASSAALQGLLDIWQGVENGFLNEMPHPEDPRIVRSSEVHYTVPAPSYPLANRPEYLLRMKSEGLSRYQAALNHALAVAQTIRPELRVKPKALRLEQAIRNALGDVGWVQTWKALS